MDRNKILTEKGWKIVEKRLRGDRLTQQDSNYLSRFVRPKLRAIVELDAAGLLRKLDYNVRARAIEERIREIVLESVEDVAAIIVCGSAVQTNYREYEDIDIIVVTGRPISGDLKQKRKLIDTIEEKGKGDGLNLDVQIYARKSILQQYPYTPSLIYQLRDAKIVYGKFDFPRKIDLSGRDLRMKLDWSDNVDAYSSGKEIYSALRNAVLVSLLMRGIVDNGELRENLGRLIGEDLAYRLKKDNVSREEKKRALAVLRSFVAMLEFELRNLRWAKIE